MVLAQTLCRHHHYDHLKYMHTYDVLTSVRMKICRDLTCMKFCVTECKKHVESSCCAETELLRVHIYACI
jgi:hypothetical protein